MIQIMVERLKTIHILAVFIILCLCLGVVPAQAGDNPVSLSVPEVTGYPGAVVQVPVNLGSNGQVVGAQFDLNFNGELLSFQGGVIGTLTAGYDLAPNQLSPGRVRLIVTSASNAAISGNAGSVAVLNFKVSDNAASGQSCPLTLSGVVLAGTGGSEVKPVSATEGLFRVVPPLKVAVPDASGHRGETVQVPVYFTSQGQVAGLQFDLSFDEQLLEYQGVNIGNLTAEFNVQANKPVGGKLKVIIVKLNAAKIPPETGSVALLKFNVRDTAQPGQSCPLILSNVILADSGGKNLGHAELSNGLFTATPGCSISLDVTPSSVSLTTGGQQQLSVSVTPSDASVSYVSGNESVARVDGSGKITAVGSGNTKITVTASKERCENSVREVPVTVTGGSSGGGGGGGGNGYTEQINLTVEPMASSLDEGEKLQLKVTVRPSDASVSYTSGNPAVATVDGSGRITAVMPGTAEITVKATRSGYSEAKKVVSVIVKAKTQSLDRCTFFDMPLSHWAAGIIEELCKKGYVKGYPGGVFKPDNNITRAEFTRILTKVIGLPDKKPATPTFSDVSPSDWYFGAVEAATGAGIIKGYESGKFLPNKNITRQEMAVILVNALGKRDAALARAGEKTKFTDDPDIASWARGYVVTSLQEGMVKGYPDNTFKPGNNASRAEACAIIDQFMENL